MTKKELAELRNAFADYKYSEGCSCCRDLKRHDEAAIRLAKLLKVPPYKDGSGFHFTKFVTLLP